MSSLPDIRRWLPVVRRLHDRIRDRVVAACETQPPDALAQVADEGDDDTIFALDRIAEAAVHEAFAAEDLGGAGVVLLAEGLPADGVVLPNGTTPEQAAWRMILDPIDGTRSLLAQKRSGWILTGVAANRGPGTSLADIQLAVQTEIPLVKQHLGDQLWALRGRGAEAERFNRLDGGRTALTFGPSRAASIRAGYAALSRFFPGARDLLAEIDERLIRLVLGVPASGKAACFEDQYACTGGQVYALASGQDRFIADLRPLMRAVLAERGEPLGHCCHPYDLCTALIAEEAGVTITDPCGAPVRAPLDTCSNVGWIGYANAAIRREVEPALQQLLREYRLLDAAG